MQTAPAPVAITEFSKARELRHMMPEDRRERSYWMAWGIFALNVVLYVVTFVFMFWPDQPFLNLACVVLNGVFIGLLFLVGHDACHGSFTPSAVLNRVLARIAFLPSLQPYSSWAYSHNGLHHGWTNLKGKDVVFVPFSLSEYQSLSKSRRFLERIYRSPFGVGLMHMIEIWWKYELFPAANHAPKDRRVFLLDRLLVVCFLIAQVSGALWLSFMATDVVWYALARTLLLLVLSYSLWFFLMGIITFQQHTHPSVPWYDSVEEWNFYRGHIHSTPHLLYPRWLHLLLHNIMDHNAHHVDPLVPMYQLTASQRSVEHACGEDIVTSMGCIRNYVKTMKICRLYDYEKHQWTDYDGTPTSAAGLNLLVTQSESSSALPKVSTPQARVLL